MSLLVVGSIAYDSIKTPHGEVSDALGGSAVYFSLAARLFTPVRLVGVVGGDFKPEDVTFLEENGVDTAGLERVPHGRTFRWSGEYTPDMNDRTTLSVELNVFEDHQPRVPESFRDSRLVFLANASPITQMSVLDQIREPGFVVADTMDLWIQTQNEELQALLRRIDGLFINDSEAIMLTRAPNLLKAARKIQAMGPECVVIKKGEHGAILVHGDATLPIPGYPTADVKDPTGAGDSFAGAFMGSLAGGAVEDRPGGPAAPDTQALKRALAFGAVVASFTVEEFGVAAIAALNEGRALERYEKFRGFLAL